MVPHAVKSTKPLPLEQDHLNPCFMRGRHTPLRKYARPANGTYRDTCVFCGEWAESNLNRALLQTSRD